MLTLERRVDLHVRPTTRTTSGSMCFSIWQGIDPHIMCGITCQILYGKGVEHVQRRPSPGVRNDYVAPGPEAYSRTGEGAHMGRSPRRRSVLSQWK